MVEVTGVENGAPAQKAGFTVGDILLEIDGHPINDVLDYRFYLTPERITCKVHRGPELIDLVVEKNEYEDIGLEFDSYLMDKGQTCTNKCIFCFIDQMPPNMRDSLYVKDDDSRMSFLTGSYITLTNLKDEDIDRIIEMRISPINISVHTTNPALRCEMMKNRFAGDSLSYINRLTNAGIELHLQIVLCRGINDGAELERTLEDLIALTPAVQSVSVVPAGLTKYRKNLYPLTSFTKEEYAYTISVVDKYRKKCVEKCGFSVFCCSDEFYIGADLPIPDEKYYDGYPQLENGVGMLRSLIDEFDDAITYVGEDFDLNIERNVSIATGRAAYPFIKGLADRVTEIAPKLKINVYEIINDFFGHQITVAGLITGTDLINQLRGKDLGDVLYIPSVMLRWENDLFLDDISLEDVENALGVKIVYNDSDGYIFLKSLLTKEKEG